MMNLKEIRDDKAYAHVVPLATFLVLSFLFTLLCESGFKWEHDLAPWWKHWPEHWFYPLQTLISGGLLVFFWKHYDLKWDRRILYGAILGVIGIAFWILPTHLYSLLGFTEETVGWLKYLGFVERSNGFNPSDMGTVTGYWISVVFRFLRAAIVVALIEEILWRGFLMRFLLDRDGDYWKVPFGKFNWVSYAVVTLAFMFVHEQVDYFGAIIYGSLMYYLAVQSKSLAACIVMHAVSNFIMGLYALEYGKYGLW